MACRGSGCGFAVSHIHDFAGSIAPRRWQLGVLKETNSKPQTLGFRGQGFWVLGWRGRLELFDCFVCLDAESGTWTVSFISALLSGLGFRG